MKRILLSMLCTLAAALLVVAQESTNPPPAVPASAGITNRQPIEILSDTLKGVLTNKTMVAVYRGNVRVSDPRLRLTADVLTVTVPLAGGRPESMVAESKVFMIALDDRGRTNTARGDKIVYSYKVSGGVTNEVVVLSGSPAVVITPDGTMTSNRIDGDLSNGTFDGGTNVIMTINAEALGGSTNGPGRDLLKR